MRLSELDLLLVPVHLPGHWVLIVVDLRVKECKLMDSRGGRDTEVLGRIKRWVDDDIRANDPARALAFVKRPWKNDRFAKGIPRQNRSNVVDCGVFMLMYVKAIIENTKMNFCQKDIPAIRLEILEALDELLLHQPVGREKKRLLRKHAAGH